MCEVKSILIEFYFSWNSFF